MRDVDEAIDFLRENNGSVRFIEIYGVPRVEVRLPGWGGYYVERDTFLDAVDAARSRHEFVTTSLGSNSSGSTGST